MKVVVLIPVFNDWAAVSQLLALLDSELARCGLPLQARALLVDDGSSTPAESEWKRTSYTAIERVDILALRRNLGHQRAITIGLAYVEANLACDAVVVMDGDGEDAPGDVPLLLRRFLEVGGQKAVFAERARRTEKLTFRIFYKFYKGAHLLLTGLKVRVGNFSVLPFSLLKKLVVVSDLWNHYAAAVFKARLPVEMIPLARGHRLAGESRMNFVSLVVHGLSAMSVYGDRIGVRLLTATSAAAVFALAVLLLGLAVRLGTGFVFPRWAINVGAALLIVLFQALATVLVFVFIVLAGRDSSSFLPVRDYGYYVDRLIPLSPAEKPQ